jgi:hypothetical protein
MAARPKYGGVASGEGETATRCGNIAALISGSLR